MVPGPGMDIRMTPSSQVMPTYAASANRGDGEDNTMKFLYENIPELGDHFVLQGVVGQGTFGRVYHAKSRKDEKRDYALKYVYPTIQPWKIAQELRYLRDIGGVKNVCGVESAISANGHVIFVLPYFPHDKLTDYLHKLTIPDIQDYMKNLLLALSQVHFFGIIHRDLKPNNFLFNYKLKKYLLVDFGLAQDQRQFQVSHKKSVYMQRSKVARSSSDWNIRQPLSVRKATINQLVKPEQNIQFMIRKRPLNETESAVTSRCKRFRNDDYHLAAQTINTQSSVFHTPDTPNTLAKSPSENSKVPDGSKVPECSKVPDGPENAVFKTPTKSTARRRSKGTGEVTVIPETPQKTVSKHPDLHPHLHPGLSGDFVPRPRVMAAPTSVVSSASTTPKSRLQDPSRLKCDCFKKAQICQICDSDGKRELYAPRWGTPGFRAPEVLLKTTEQSTAIDIWSAGVIFASLLSKRYPFFRNDDMDSLAEIVTFLGFKRVSVAAAKMGRTITLSKTDAARYKDPPNMKLVLSCLRNGTNNLSVNSENRELIPDSAIDLLNQLLEPHPAKRITAVQALKHPFITNTLPLVQISTPNTPESSQS